MWDVDDKTLPHSAYTFLPVYPHTKRFNRFENKSHSFFLLLPLSKPTAEEFGVHVCTSRKRNHLQEYISRSPSCFGGGEGFPLPTSPSYCCTYLPPAAHNCEPWVLLLWPLRPNSIYCWSHIPQPAQKLLEPEKQDHWSCLKTYYLSYFKVLINKRLVEEWSKDLVSGRFNSGKIFPISKAFHTSALGCWEKRV